MDAEIGER